MAWRLHRRWSATTPPMVLGIFRSTLLVMVGGFDFCTLMLPAYVVVVGVPGWILVMIPVISWCGVLIVSDLNVLT